MTTKTLASENLDELLYHIELDSSVQPPAPRIDGRFVDPRQIARTMRAMLKENWQYAGPRYKDSDNGDVHMIEYGDLERPLRCDAQGRWILAHDDRMHYGEPDEEGTLILLRFAQEHHL